MNIKNSPRYYSTHHSDSHKLPQLLQNKTGFINRLQQQDSRRGKREEYQQVIQKQINSNTSSFLARQKMHHAKTEQIHQRLSLSELETKRNREQFIKRSGNVMKKARDNKENLERREMKARKDLFARETEKLEKSVVLRESFWANKSGHVSKSSKSERSLERSVLSVDPGESLDRINSRLERARVHRELKFDVLGETRTKLEERRENAMLKASKSRETFMNKSLHSYLKSMGNLQLRLSDIKLTKQKSIQMNSRQEKNKKQKASLKCHRQYQESLNKILKQNENLEKKMENALRVRVKQEETKKSDLMQKTRESMSKAITKQNSKKSAEFLQKEQILNKFNNDFRAFKVFKTELLKSAIN